MPITIATKAIAAVAVNATNLSFFFLFMPWCLPLSHHHLWIRSLSFHDPCSWSCWHLYCLYQFDDGPCPHQFRYCLASSCPYFGAKFCFSWVALQFLYRQRWMLPGRSCPLQCLIFHHGLLSFCFCHYLLSTPCLHHLCHYFYQSFLRPRREKDQHGLQWRNLADLLWPNRPLKWSLKDSFWRPFSSSGRDG